MSGTVWMWSMDAKHPRGILEFLSDGKIKYRYQNREGAWYIRSDGYLFAKFGGEDHYLQYYNGAAILLQPYRSPPSVMIWLKGKLKIEFIKQEQYNILV